MGDHTFVPGLELCEGFFADHVAPVLASRWPALRYTAALIGPGSEVLGFDTPTSTDHHWGPRVMLFLEAADHTALAGAARAHLGLHLPPSYRGYSTHFTAPDPLDHGTQMLAPHQGGPINHRIELHTLNGYFLGYLGLRPSDAMSAADWLSLPAQKLRSIVAGGVFRDDLGLNALRQRLTWYPDDVWMYVLGSLWNRIGQEEHLLGRAASVGDELGSAIIAGRLVRDLMSILFCLRREYRPYPKWFGSAFARLDGAAELRPHLEAALRAPTFREREPCLCAAYEQLAALQQAAGLPIGGDGRTSPFWGRPFRVIHGERVAGALFSRIADAELAALARESPIRNLDAVSDNTDVLESTSLRRRLGELYEP